MPREITVWGAVCDEGIVKATYTTYETALKCLGVRSDRRIVKLTGKAPEPKKVKKTVWVNIYMNESGSLHLGNTLYNSEEFATEVGRRKSGYFGTLQKTVEEE